MSARLLPKIPFPEGAPRPVHSSLAVKPGDTRGAWVTHHGGKQGAGGLPGPAPSSGASRALASVSAGLGCTDWYPGLLACGFLPSSGEPGRASFLVGSSRTGGSDAPDPDRVRSQGGQEQTAILFPWLRVCATAILFWDPRLAPAWCHLSYAQRLQDQP